VCPDLFAKLPDVFIDQTLIIFLNVVDMIDKVEMKYRRENTITKR
jgi:hypothetical protein